MVATVVPCSLGLEMSFCVASFQLRSPSLTFRFSLRIRSITLSPRLTFCTDGFVDISSVDEVCDELTLTMVTSGSSVGQSSVTLGDTDLRKGFSAASINDLLCIGDLETTAAIGILGRGFSVVFGELIGLFLVGSGMECELDIELGLGSLMEGL